MRLLLVLLVFLVLLGPVLAQPAHAAAPVVAVLPFAGDDAVITDDVRTALSALGVVEVASQKAVADQLAAAHALGLACAAATPACAVQVGGLGGADVVVTGAVVVEKGTVTVSARAFSVAGSSLRASAHVDVPKDGAARAAALKLLAVRLVAPERERGRITVRAKPDGATVVVDGVVRANAAHGIDVLPGKHNIYVAHVGYDSRSESVDVGFDQDAVFDVALVAGKENKPLPLTLTDPSSSPAEPAPKKRFVRVAVYELSAAEYPARVPHVVTEALLAEIRKLEGVSVVGLDEIRAMIDFEANRQLAGCNGDTSCLSDIAGALGADIVLVGTLAHVGDGTVFGMKKLDQKNGQSVGQIDKRFVDAGGEEYIAAVGSVVEELFPELPLRPGMKRGADPQLALRVNPPPLSPWVFWSTASIAAVTGVATTATGVVNLASAGKYAGVTTAVPGRDVVNNDAFVRGTGIAFWTGVGVTAVGLAGAGVEALFVDWWGYADADRALDLTKPPALGAPTRAAPALAPAPVASGGAR